MKIFRGIPYIEHKYVDSPVSTIQQSRVVKSRQSRKSPKNIGGIMRTSCDLPASTHQTQINSFADVSSHLPKTPQPPPSSLQYPSITSRILHQERTVVSTQLGIAAANK